jgi:hypothetical protein
MPLDQTSALDHEDIESLIKGIAPVIRELVARETKRVQDTARQDLEAVARAIIEGLRK